MVHVLSSFKPTILSQPPPHNNKLSDKRAIVAEGGLRWALLLWKLELTLSLESMFRVISDQIESFSLAAPFQVSCQSQLERNIFGFSQEVFSLANFGRGFTFGEIFHLSCSCAQTFIVWLLLILGLILGEGCSQSKLHCVMTAKSYRQLRVNDVYLACLIVTIT